MIATTVHQADDEVALLQKVRQWPHYQSLEEISESALRRITAEQGIDFATALLFDRITGSPKHGEFVRQIDACRDIDSDQPWNTDVTVAVAPGAFYLEYPHTGAAGDVVLAEAARMGFRTALIPTSSVGTPRENGQLICRWLRERREETIILGSLSKGGTDVKMAMSERGAAQTFGNVMGWINVGGILYGSPMSSWILNRRFASIAYRLLFFCFRKRFEFVTSLERRTGGELDFELSLPEHLNLINVIGFPLRRHLSSRRAERWHQRIGELGPNESVTLLHDALRLPGHLLPVWGVDHYLQEGWEASRLIRALLYYVASEAKQSPSSRQRPLGIWG